MHFTYCTPEGDNLKQGDVLKRTPALEELLSEVHPHYYKNRDYRFFIVLSQSCDLVARGGTRKSRYLLLASVRPLATAVERELADYSSDLETLAGVYSKKQREKLRIFLEKIYNNNETRYFYLHADAESQIPEPMCAFLHLTIAIRTTEHHDMCLDARVASLRNEFQAKLGWLVGNLYSRVGTEDWVPAAEEQKDFKLRLKADLDEAAVWVDDKRIQQARKVLRDAGDSLSTMTSEEAKSLVESQQITKPRDVAIARLRDILGSETRTRGASLNDKQINAIVAALTSDQQFSNALRD